MYVCMYIMTYESLILIPILKKKKKRKKEKKKGIWAEHFKL